MKRVLTFCAVCVLFAGQASAVLCELDKDTVLHFLNESIITGTQTNTISVYDGQTTKVYGPGPPEYGPMSGLVGFYGGLVGDVPYPTYGGDAILEIYYDDGSGGTNPGLLGDDYDGIRCYFENDNQSKWSVQLFYVDPTDGGERASAWAELDGLGGSAYLSANASGSGLLDLANITNIGFRIMGENMGGSDPRYPSYSDAFFISLVVPEPTTLLLLGLGGVMLKRKRS